jgi:alanyl-tRNA synthetase
MNPLRANYEALLKALGKSIENIKLNAKGEPDVTAEDLQGLTAQVEAVKTEAEATAKAKDAALATAKADHEKAIAELKAAHETALKAETDKVSALEEKVKELGGKPGGEPTGLQTEGDQPADANALGLPDYVNAELPIYKELAAMHARLN